MWENTLKTILLISLTTIVVVSGDDAYDMENTVTTNGAGGGNKVKIEGKVIMPQEDSITDKWRSNTRILINYGEYVGFVREDNTFVINNIPPGSYIVEVANKDYIFEPFRVDVTSKGKIRARKLLHLQPSSVVGVPYPLKFVSKQPAQYFKAREQWRVTDFLMNPMVLMMVVPFLLIMVLPKLINTSDPEVQREMQNSLQMPKYDLPELSELMTNFFGGGSKKPKQKALTGKTKKS